MKKQQDHGGFLWIKGHPSTGKSTLMKLLFEEANFDAQNDPNQIVLYFSSLRGVLSRNDQQRVCIALFSISFSIEHTS